MRIQDRDPYRALNDQQHAAVMAPDGPILVIAAAGTGKTRTLTARVAHLVQRGVPADRILLLTFTNRAAGEMLERARRLAGDEVSGLWGGTFHHLANRILRRHAARLGFHSDYTILDSDDSARLLRACMRELHCSSRMVPKPQVLLNLFGMAAATERNVEEVAEERFEHTSLDVAAMVRIGRLYTARKRELNSMDFDDLLVHCWRLFCECEEVCAYYQERFLHVLVDEYQDTNRIQSDWIDRIAAPRHHIMVVGDDFQSIYSWRGADYRNIMSFPERYAQAQVFKLETNYRSLPGILDVANACIAGNPLQFQKELHAVRSGERRPELATLRDGPHQAGYIIDYVRRLREEGYRLDEMAVLYRSHFHALDLQLELTRAGFPFAITSGLRFFEQAHIKDVCALPRIAVNPADELAFMRLLTLLPRVGDRTAARLWREMGGRFDASSATARRQLVEGLAPAAREGAQCMADLLQAYHEANGEVSPAAMIDEFVHRFYDAYAVRAFDNHEARAEDLAELSVFASRYRRLEPFLAETVLLTNLDTLGGEDSGQEKVLRLSTVHQAKGLEWRVVFVLWMADGMFPSGRSMASEEALAEERRLFYVAVTRARDRLVLCFPKWRRMKNSGTMGCVPSRFIQELPRGLLMDSGRPGTVRAH